MNEIKRKIASIGEFAVKKSAKEIPKEEDVFGENYIFDANYNQLEKDTELTEKDTESTEKDTESTEKDTESTEKDTDHSYVSKSHSKNVPLGEIKEKLSILISRIASRGMLEEEKIKFTEEFTFWNDSLFDFLDISNNLKKVMGNSSVSVTPKQSLLIYGVGVIAIILLLRPDIIQNLKGKKNLSEIKQQSNQINRKPQSLNTTKINFPTE